MQCLALKMTLLSRLISYLLICLALNSCETATTIEVQGYPPKIRLFGSGSMAQLIVTGPFLASEVKLGQLNSKELRLLWQINPGGAYNSINVSRVPTIVYGIVPPGCKQIYPSDGPPTSLIEGSYYGISVPTRGAPDIPIIFKIEKGEPVKVPSSGGKY